MAVQKAAEALDRNHGRPSRYSVLFVADRHREQGADEMAVLLENTVLDGFSGSVEQLPSII